MLEPKVTILPETTKDPIQLIGRRAGVCYGADITDPEKNYKRGLDCLKNNHGRALEYINVEAVLSGISCRLGREWYTHIGGAPTRLQASTRYIDYSKGFDYVIPKSIKNDSVALEKYEYAMKVIADTANYLVTELNVPKEDAANLFPLGMETVIVDKRNARNLIDMSHQRKCTRAYWEFRKLFKTYSNNLREYGEEYKGQFGNEWAYIIDNYFKPKCDLFGYCIEKFSCGRKPKREE